MSELTQFKIFIQGLMKPIINEAVEEAVSKALSHSDIKTTESYLSILQDDFLSLKEAAEFLNVAPQTIYQNIKRIPHMKRFGKLAFKRSELVAYLEEGKVPQKNRA